MLRSSSNSLLALSTGALGLLLAAIVGGCEPGSPTPVPPSAGPPSAGPGPVAAKPAKAAPKPAKGPPAKKPEAKPAVPPRQPPSAPLADLMEEADRQIDPLAVVPRAGGAERAIDEKKAEAHGIRKVAGAHLTLFTDLPPSPDIDELPKVFDLALPQWGEYFRVPADKIAGWKVRATLMSSKEKRTRFQAAGLLPDGLPDFPFGYARDYEFWLFDQPSAFYRRHLFLHEGTHAFMFHFLGGAGPAWYTEGVAELCGTHRWENGQLTLRYFPKNKEETPEWGRIKIIRDEVFKPTGAMSVEGIMGYSDRAHSKTEPYAWCWGLCAFLDGHPRFQGAFRKMQEQTRDRRGFNDKFWQLLPDEERAALQEQWQLFFWNLDYGYDVARADFEIRRGEPLPAGGKTVIVAADKYWQPSGIHVEAGKQYRLAATGRYEVGRTTKPWACEPPGVTLRYHQGKPLGMLLAAVREDEFKGQLTGLASPTPIGAGAVYTAPKTGTLYFAINESPGGLADNAGTLSVQVTAEP